MTLSHTDIIRRLLDEFSDSAISASDLQLGCLRSFCDESTATFFEIASAEARDAIVKAVNDSPRTDSEWATFLMCQPECDAEELTNDWRRGVESVRRYLEGRYA